MATYFEREFKRKDGTTYKKWCAEEKINGKPKTVYGKTKKECKAKLDKFTVELANNGFILDKNYITVTKWMYNYLFTDVLTRVSAGTFDVYMGIYNKHINGSNLGNLKIQDVTQMDITKYFNDKLDNSQAWNNKIKFLLNGAFKYAKVNRHIHFNPLDDFKMPKSNTEEKQITVFTLKEQKEYVRFLTDSTIDRLLLTALYTGLRMGELIALTWDNYNGTSLEVKQSVKYCKKYDSTGNYVKQNVLKGPKTKKSIRSVPLPNKIITLLDNMDHKTKYIFASKNNTYLGITNIRRRHFNLCDQANVPKINLHALRHDYATRLLELEESPRVVQVLLGHANVKTTLNIYSHVLEETKTQAVNKLNLL